MTLASIVISKPDCWPEERGVCWERLKSMGRDACRYELLQCPKGRHKEAGQ